MRDSVKNFIEENISLIDKNELVTFLEKADERFTPTNMEELISVLRSSGIDIEEPALYLISDNILTYCYDNLHRRSNSEVSYRWWSRLLTALKMIPSYGISSDEIAQFIRNHAFFSKNMKIRPLDMKHSTTPGKQDYDLGWFFG